MTETETYECKACRAAFRCDSVHKIEVKFCPSCGSFFIVRKVEDTQPIL